MVSKAPVFTSSTFSHRMNPKGGSGGNKQVRNAAMMTEPLTWAESGTSTRVEMADVGVSDNPVFDLAKFDFFL